MKEIVEWLRGEVPHCDDPSNYDEWELRMLEAADEIERLRINLRDHFATAALSSMLSHPQNMSEGTPALAAEWAYKFADAMLEHRTALGEGK